MKRVLFLCFIIFSFAVLVSSCGEEEEYSTSSTDNTSSSTTLSAPSDLSATGAAGQVTLDWAVLSGALSYTVYWDNATGVSSSSTAITSVSTDNYTHSGLDNGSTYYYKVAGVNSAGTGTLSSEVSASTPLPAPDNLSATAGFKQVSLDWDNVTGATSYTVYWDNATGVSSSSTAITSLSDDNYTHNGLTGGVTYYYKVAAVNSSGTGTLSTEANATAGASQMIGGSMQGEELNLTGAVTTIAGSGSTGHGDNTNGVLAKFNDPRQITTDGTNLYLADKRNHQIRQIVISSGAVTSLAGNVNGGTRDDTGTSAQFFYPEGITADGTNLYVAMGSIRKVALPSAVVTTPVASGLNGVGDITSDGTNLYLTNNSTHIVLKVVISSSQVSTIAGSSGSSGSNDATGTSATFNTPRGITTDGTNLYVADSGNHKIRKIVISSGVVTTIAGSGSSGSNDATGTSATFDGPLGITTDGTNLYVADTGNHKIRKIVISSRVVTTIAGSGGQGSSDHNTGTSATFNTPEGITTDGTSLFVTANKIRKID